MSRTAPKLLVLILNILLTSFLLNLKANAQEQSKKYLEYNITNTKFKLSVKETIALIEQETPLRFVYTNELLKNVETLALRSKRYKVIELLDEFLQQVGLTYQQKRNMLILSKIKLSPVIVKQPKSYVISGIIKEEGTEETMIGATLLAISPSGKKTGTISNPYGFYSLTLPEGKYQLVFSYIGYYADTFNLNLSGHIRLNWNMIPYSRRLEQVTVLGEKEMDFSLGDVQMSAHRLDNKKIGKLPFLYGEVDVMRALGNMPGVNTIGQVSTGFNVRGGEIDQNLLLLDDAPVYYASHFFGLISVFNPDIVREAKIFKGSVPAMHGGSLSSVTEIWQREGSNDEYIISGGLGVVSSRLSFEGPIKRDKSTFLISGRSSFADLANVVLRNSGLNNIDAGFNDLNFKLNYKINPKNTLYLSGYVGRDYSNFENGEEFEWGNMNGSLRWNRIYHSKLFANLTAVYSRYDYNSIDFSGVENSELRSKIISYRLKDDFTWFKSPEHTFSFGGQLVFHEFSPASFSIEDGRESQFALQSEFGLETALYFSDEWKISEKLNVDMGLRYSALFNVGPQEVFEYSSVGPVVSEQPIDTLNYNLSEVIKAYHGPEPRLALKYSLSSSKALKASYNRNRQYIHLVSNSTTSFLTDIWKLSGKHVKPQIADQVALGYFQSFQKHSLDVSLEVYYKQMRNLLEYKDGADIVLNDRLETDLLNSQGVSFGLEFLLNWETKKFDGIVSYALSRSLRRTTGDFEAEMINNGGFFPANSDRLHDLRLVGTYHLNDKWSFSATFTYASGRPITLPDSKFIFEGKAVPNFSQRNQDRLPAHHRLDLAAIKRARVYKKRGKKAGKMKRTQGFWTFSVYNVYSRQNAFSVNFLRDSNNPAVGRIEQYPIFTTVVPSVTYNFDNKKR